MTDKQIKKYCKGLCAVCDELGIYNKEPCIYKIANELEENLSCKEQECEELKRCLLQVQNASISLNKQLDQFKQTLTEIKEIAEDAKTKVFVDMEEFWKQILQKISGTENAR